MKDDKLYKLIDWIDQLSSNEYSQQSQYKHEVSELYLHSNSLFNKILASNESIHSDTIAPCTFEPFQIPQPTQTIPPSETLIIVRGLIEYLTNRNIKLARQKHSDSQQKQNGISPVITRTTTTAKRIDTNIVKVLYTQFKHLLDHTKGCPVKMDIFFRVCDIKRSNRSLIDFETPIWYVQKLNFFYPGILDQFRRYLITVKCQILQHGRRCYSQHIEKLERYQQCAEKVFKALITADTTEERLHIMYGKRSCHKTSQLNKIQESLMIIIQSTHKNDLI